MKLNEPKAIIIAALITGGCAVIAAIIALINGVDNTSRQLLPPETPSTTLPIATTSWSEPVEAVLPTTLPQGEPILFSARELEEWCTRYPNDLQAEEATRNLFYGKYIQFTGKVWDISSVGTFFNLYIITDDGVFVAAGFESQDSIEKLVRDQQVNVLGKINKVCSVISLGESILLP